MDMYIYIYILYVHMHIASPLVTRYLPRAEIWLHTTTCPMIPWQSSKNNSVAYLYLPVDYELLRAWLGN